MSGSPWGSPFELTPGALAASTMVSSGAVTKRVDRCLEKGRALIDEAFEAHMANEQRLVEGLGDLGRSRLAHLLETWGRALDA